MQKRTVISRGLFLFLAFVVVLGIFPTHAMAQDTETINQDASIQATSFFNDVAPRNWFYPYVRFVYSNGLMQGTGGGAFSPNATLTRGMVITVLWRLAGEPIELGGIEFDDVRADRWYADAVNWASENGIAHGFGGGRFGPNVSVTREQLAVFFRNFAIYEGLDTSGGSFVGNFTDVSEISRWALEAMQWANASGLIRGRTATTIAPGGSATRAEAAAMLRRLIENVLDIPAWEVAMNQALDYIESVVTTPMVGSVGGEWAILALARSGRVTATSPRIQPWLAELETLLVEVDRLTQLGHDINNPPGIGTFPSALRRQTDFQRVTIALSSLGLDASNFRGHDLTAVYRTFVPSNQRHAINQTINVDTFALIALDTGPYSGDRSAFVNALLNAQRADGSFSLNPAQPSSAFDIDTTAMAITALASDYRQRSPQAIAAVERALGFLRRQTFSDPEGIAQMIVALTSLGANYQSEAEQFVNHMLGWFDHNTGAFRRPNPDSPINLMATEQAAYALVAYWRLVNGMSSLYDMQAEAKQT